MARKIYKYVNGKLEEVFNSDELAKRPVHYIQTDELPEPVESYATDEGKMFTSKSALRRHYKEHGYEDTGGSHLTGNGLKPYKANYEEIRNTVAEQLNKLKWGMAPLSEREKESCRKEQTLSKEVLKNLRWD